MFFLFPSSLVITTVLLNALPCFVTAPNSVYQGRRLNSGSLTNALATISLCKSGQGDAVNGCRLQHRRTRQSNAQWDKSRFTREQYQKRVCGKTCDGQNVRDSNELTCPNVECFDCMCERPICHLYGICCPTYGAKHQSNKIQPPQTATVARGDDFGTSADGLSREPSNHPMVKCEVPDGKSEGYLYIQSCPSGFMNSQTKELCEKDFDPTEDTTLDQFARVSDTATKAVYHNKFCALCNGVVESVQWNVSVSCDHFLFVYSATTFDQLLSNSLRPNSACSVEQEPLVKHLTPCRPVWFSDKIIDRCNTTGLWKSRDKDIEEACLQLSGRSLSVYIKSQSSSSMLFKNIFCVICNMDDNLGCRDPLSREPLLSGFPGLSFVVAQVSISHSLYSANSAAGFEGTGHSGHELVANPIGPPKRQPPFRLILSLRRRKPRHSRPVYESAFTFSACGSGEWSSPDGQCLRMNCSPGKLGVNESCVTALPQIRGLGYRLRMWFEPDTNRSLNVTDMFYSSNDYLTMASQTFENMVKSQLNGSFDSYEISLKSAISGHKSNEEDRIPQTESFKPAADFWLQVFVTANKEILRDDFEARLAALEESLARSPPSHLGLFSRRNFEDLSPHALCSLPGVVCQGTLGSFDPSSSLTFSAKGAFLKTEQNLGCRHVQFNDSSYEIDKIEREASLLPRTELSLRLGGTKVTFTEKSEITTLSVDERGLLRVCCDVLDSKLQELEDERQREFYAKFHNQSGQSSVEKAQYFLTLVCLGVSMVCLVLTLLTYFSFKVLRNAAGMNNIFLCGSLLLAQAFLLASSHVSGPKTLCTVLGAITHFLWLWMFVWSFICCFHMFRVFVTAATGERQSSWSCCCTSSLTRTVALSLVCPATVVIIIIIVSVATSAGDKTGYGRDSCFLDSALLVGLTTVLPLVLVTAANITFFSITAWKLHKIRKLQSQEFFKKKERTNFYIYVKLSSITGAFWLVQILAEALNNDVLRFIAIVTNGLQGVFIFVSYTCNKRVLNMYLQGRGSKQQTSSTALDSQRKNKGEGTVQQPNKSSSCSTSSSTCTSSVAGSTSCEMSA